MQYTPKTFFRLVPKDLLRRYFADRNELTDFPWDEAEDGGDVAPLFEAWQELPPAERAETESAFRAVWDLSSADGARILIEEGEFHQLDLATALDALDGFQHKALWVYVEHQRVFRVAHDINHADKLHRRYWRTRKDMPLKEPDDSTAMLEALGMAISAFYREQGRGYDCRVECYLRGGRRHYYFAYPSDYTDTFVGYDGSGRFVRRAQKPAFEVVFVYDPIDGTLDLFAQGGKKVGRQLQEIFGRVILGEELGPENRVVTPFELHGLKSRDFAFPTDPADGIIEVRVKALRLAILGGSRRVTLEVDVGGARNCTN